MYQIPVKMYEYFSGHLFIQKFITFVHSTFLRLD